ncbi:MAG: hypothetical protein F4Y20_07310 [Acidobacteria bacterium]|nr:hypothetical protein [Gemmatimonadota bacterium]MYB32316.1 hypothetical protein [Acidobacteriota bacterium]MYH23530.1 hypothetical protein [Acidobacteriota bacterium]MYJ10508.1 hypothetical protein [Gemmatimonadota bacterium]MYK80797.1 hypothetical protein [Acidobacteriota bacterium]
MTRTVAEPVLDSVRAEEYADFESEVRGKLDHLVEAVDDIKIGIARHSAAIEALAAHQPPKIRRAVRDAQAAVSLPMAAKDG